MTDSWFIILRFIIYIHFRIAREFSRYASIIMEDLKGLQFRVLNADELIVESKTDHSIELENSEKLMLYNFVQMERFCHRLGKRKMNEFDKSSYRYYVVLKTFGDENLHAPGNEAKIYSIAPYIYNLSFLFSIYGNGKKDRYNKDHFEDKGFITIDIVHPFFSPSITYEQVNFFISIIDIEGKKRFTQSGEFNLKSKDDVKSFPKFLSRETVLRNSFELLHNNDLIFCVNLEFYKNTDIHADNNGICLFEKYPYTHALLLSTNIGKCVCEKLQIFDQMFDETQSTNGSFVKKDLKNICKILIVTNYINKINFKDIRTLYRMARSFKIAPLQEFCSFLLERLSDGLQFKRVDAPKIAANIRDIAKQFNIIYHAEESGRSSARTAVASGNIPNATSEYTECYCPDENMEEIVSRDYIERLIELDFGSFFSVDENGDLILLLNSNFGKLLYRKSAFLKRMTEHSWVETQRQSIRIQQEDFEVFKNIYRLLMGANCIKRNSIFDIISLYEISDYYDIPDIMNTCIHLFKRHISDENFIPILELAEMYHDVRLLEIVEAYEAKHIEEKDRFITLYRKIPASVNQLSQEIA